MGTHLGLWLVEGVTSAIYNLDQPCWKGAKTTMDID